MRTRDYVSPTSVKCFYDSVEEFYCRYLSDIKLPRDPQTPPMAIGSAFDAHVKSYLHEAIYGKGADPKYGFDALFEAQVEVHNRDHVRRHGEYAFKSYKQSGALSDLLIELNRASKAPQFEVEIRGAIDTGKQREFGNVVILGKPDVYFYNHQGFLVILDWKVNGYFSKGNTSPAKGYLKLRDATGPSIKDKMHKECTPIHYMGMTINGQLPLEDANEDWAAQIASYAWILGQPVGSEFLALIDQIVGNNSLGLDTPELRIAEHKSRVSKEFQLLTFAKAQHVWDVIQSGHVFREMSRADSDRRCKILDETLRMKASEPVDDLFNSFIPSKKSW